jgi:hypothetical protein
MQNDRKQLLEELNQHGPILHQLKMTASTEQDAQAPIGYYEHLADRLLDQIQPEYRPLKPTWHRAAAVAAALMLLSGTLIWRLSHRKAVVESALDAETHILASIDDYEPELLARLASDMEADQGALVPDAAFLEKMSDRDIEALMIELAAERE